MSSLKTTKWCVPEDGIPLLTMPNVPHALHGLAPRIIMGATEWNKTRKACYAEHDNICEICGRLCGSKRGDQYMRQAHECYEIDYANKSCTFKRLCCICSSCHNVIHSGRAITMYKSHTPLWTKQSMLDLAEHGFRLIYKWNQQHPDKQLKMFQTIEEWLKEPSLTDNLRRLIDQYHIEFYYVPETNTKEDWGKWKLIYNDVEYYSPYHSIEDWQAAMNKNNEHDKIERKQLFDGDEFAELRHNIGKE